MKSVAAECIKSLGGRLFISPFVGISGAAVGGGIGVTVGTLFFPGVGSIGGAAVGGQWGEAVGGALGGLTTVIAPS